MTNTPDTLQTQMDVHMGHSPSIEASSRQIDNIAWKMNIVTVTDDHTVTVNESGTFFITGGTGDIEFTLPTPVDGLIYWFYSTVDDELLLTAHAANKMVAFNDIDADAVEYTEDGEQIGSGFICFTNGTMWYVAPMLASVATSMVVTT